MTPGVPCHITVVIAHFFVSCVTLHASIPCKDLKYGMGLEAGWRGGGVHLGLGFIAWDVH